MGVEEKLKEDSPWCSRILGWKEKKSAGKENQESPIFKPAKVKRNPGVLWRGSKITNATEITNRTLRAKVIQIWDQRQYVEIP